MCRILILTLVAASFAAGDDCPSNPSKLRIDDDSVKYVQVGDSFKFRCTVDDGPGFLMAKMLNIVFRSAKTGQEQTLTEQGHKITKRDEFMLYFDFKPYVYTELTVTNVKEDMDGEFICQVVGPSTPPTPPECSVSKRVVVVGGIDKIVLNFDGQMYRRVTNNHLDRHEGRYKVTCEASGSNPEPVLHLQIGDQMLEAPNTVILDQSSELERRVYAVSTVIYLNFTHAMFGKMLKCHAATNLPNDVTMNLPEKNAAVTINAILDKPVVVCTNSSAGVHDRKITINCRVKSTAPLDMYYNVGNRYILYPGNQSEDHTEVIRELDGEDQVMILKFFKMEQWHFTSNIYMGITYSSGRTFQTPVYLIRAESGGEQTWDVNGASTFTTGAITVALLCALAANFPRL